MMPFSASLTCQRTRLIAHSEDPHSPLRNYETETKAYERGAYAVLRGLENTYEQQAQA